MAVVPQQNREFDALMRLLRRATQCHRFTLIFIHCDSFHQQQQLQQTLQQRCAQQQITLTAIELWSQPPIDNLYQTLHQHLTQTFADPRPDRLALQVSGLELSILLDADEQAPAVLQILNLSRERFWAELPYPLLIWLPDYAYVKLANVAPDFWAVRDGSFAFFANTASDWASDLDRMTVEPQDLTAWRDKTDQIPLIERILASSPVALPFATQLDLRLKLADCYRFVGKPSQGKENLDRVLRSLSESAADSAADVERESAALNGLGLVYIDLEQFDDAIQAFQQYLSLQPDNPEIQAIGYNHLGFARYKLGIAQDQPAQLEQAIAAYETALQLNRQMGKRQAEGDVLGNLGLVYRQQRDFEQAIAAHQQALTISREMDRPQSEVKDLGNLGLVYHKRQDYQPALDYYTQALQLSQRLGNQQDELHQQLNSGDVCRDMGDLELAREHYEAAHGIATRLGLTRLTSTALERLIDLDNPVIDDAAIDLKNPDTLHQLDCKLHWVEKWIEQREKTAPLNPQLQCQYGVKKLLALCNESYWLLSQKHEWLLQARTWVENAFQPNTVPYCKQMLQICQGLGQSERAVSLQAELEQLKRERQLVIWLAPGAAEVEDNCLILYSQQFYTFHMQIGAEVPESAWSYRHDLPDEVPKSNLAAQPIEGFRQTTETTTAIEDELSKPSDLMTEQPASPGSSAQHVLAAVSPANRTEMNAPGQFLPPLNLNLPKPAPDSILSLDFQGRSLGISPATASLPLSKTPSANIVNLTVETKNSVNCRIEVVIRFQDRKTQDNFEIPVQVVDGPVGQAQISSRLNTSDRSKKRVTFLLKNLLAYANYELTDCDHLLGKLAVRWQDEGEKHNLIVRTTLASLAELISEHPKSKKAKEKIRHDLRLLKDFVGILDDRRTTIHGSAEWHFALRLWHRSTEHNLWEFEQAWQSRRKLLGRKPSGFESVLNPSQYLDTVRDRAETTLSNFDFATTVQEKPYPCHNLPNRHYKTFVGLNEQIDRLMGLLSPDCPTQLIAIEGAGGTGKTTLALEAAYRCLAATQAPGVFPTLPGFDALIFTSAQPQQLVTARRSSLPQPERNLRDIFSTILKTLNTFDEMPPTFQEQLEWARESLSRQSTLVIVDNLETLEDQEYVLAFLREIPLTVKAILTSRVRSSLSTSIYLDCLDRQASLAFIHSQVQEKEKYLTPAEAEAIYQKTGGLPLAIVYAIGQVAVYGLPLHAVTTHLAQSTSSLVHRCFEESFQQLQGRPAGALLSALTLFPRAASRNALAHVAFQNPDLRTTRTGLETLYQLSLVTRPKTQYYAIHSLTREYVNNDLSERPAFKQALRDRWLAWYRRFLAPYGTRDWQHYYDYSPLEQDWENLRAAVDWSIQQERYEDFQQLWQNLKGYTLFCGRWQERLEWMDWLIATAEADEDWATVADAVYHKSRTLGHINRSDKTDEALQLGKWAWDLARWRDREFEFEMAIYLTAFHTQRKQFEQSRHWLSQARKKLKQAPNDDPTRGLQQLHLLYCQAQIEWRNRQYAKARAAYQQALKQAETIGRQRMVYYIQGGLAEVALEQGALDEAKALFVLTLEAATQNNERQAMALCQRPLALLEQKRGNLAEAQYWAEQAKNSFERLRMTQAAHGMNVLLQELETQAGQS